MLLHSSKATCFCPLVLAVCLWRLTAAPGLAQPLVIDHDIRIVSSLANTTATLTGRSELRITSSASPITNSTIHLDSPDSWLFLPSIKPSVVNTSTYLNQIRVNGANAALNSNIRIVQHGDGSVVIPHSSGFAPLQVFTGRNFSGSSVSLASYTAYDNTNLGSFNDRIRSFKLKRGYTCTIAQNSNGTGVSRNYVAQDGDLEVAVMPTGLVDSVSFIRVFPWRWTNKKGIAGDIESGLNVNWVYNWNISRNSTLDLEYVPIRQNRWWPGLGQNWQSRGANHLLGYNEPDRPDQANLTVSEAIGGWPDLLATGLRAGAPAVSDGGLSWLYDFIDQADAANLRVDFVPIHYYRCRTPSDAAGAATQFYDFLKGIHDRTKRPLWVTEWNNGANWTTCADPTFAQQQAAVAAMIDMLEETPFVERYALYNWVEDVRRVKWDDGWLTAAGVTYRDKVSSISHRQVVPEIPTSTASFLQFENNTRDSSPGGHSAISAGAATYTTGRRGKALLLTGEAARADHVLLSPRTGDSTDFSFSAWVYWTGGPNWQRIFDLGADTTNHMFLTPKSSAGTLRFAIRRGSTEQQLNHNAALPTNTWSHVAVTLSGNTGKLFLNGNLVASNTGMNLNPVDIGTSENFLGKSRFSADPYFAGRLDDVQFLPFALPDAKVTNTPPIFSSAEITGPLASQGIPYSGSLAEAATDADAGDTITFSKIDGPAWLSVAANGALTGTPSSSDGGLQRFAVQATDSAGASSFAVLAIQFDTDGTWLRDANGTWSEPENWAADTPANGSGSAADFSTIDISSDRTVTLDSPRRIGTIRFGDAAGSQSWTLSSSGGSILTFASATTTPSVVVDQNTATIASPLVGSSGLNKSGAGTLVLAGSSSISGNLAIDTNNNAAAGGSVRLAHPAAASTYSSILIRNNNSGSSTLELDGTSGAVSSPAAIALSGRNNTVPAILNLTGNNTLSGSLTLATGGGSYIFKSDAGTLTFGPISSSATGTRTLTFVGDGGFAVSGAISNGSASNGVAIVKSGSGSLALTGNNTHTGPTNLNGGSISLSGSGTLGSGPLHTAEGTSLLIHRNLTLPNTVTGPASITSTASCSITGDFSGFTGSYTHNSSIVSTSLGSTTATSRNASYHIASTQGSLQGMIVTVNGNNTLELGALSGVAGSLFRGGLSATGTTTLRIGHLGTSTAFNGSINNGSKILAVEKVGAGTFTLNGNSNYTGGTTVREGILTVNGSTGTGSMTVADGATLAGGGDIGGSVQIESGGILAPGSGASRLQIAGNLTLANGSITRLNLSTSAATNDKLAITGSITLGGNLVVNSPSGSPAHGSVFDLFDASNPATASFASITLPPLPSGLRWNTSQLSTGIIAVEHDPNTFHGWSATYQFPPGEDTPGSDPDADGYANLAEWMLGTHPLEPGAPEITTSIAPGTTIQGADPSKSYLTLTARIRKNPVGVTIIPQAHSSLELLHTPAALGLTSSKHTADLGDFELRTWHLIQAIEDFPHPQVFMRLKFVLD